MSSTAYRGTRNRTFSATLRQLLEKEYRLLGSRRVLDLLTQDIEELIERFYPKPERLAPGWMLFTGTKAEGPKPRQGQTAADLPLLTIPWPVLLPEDIEALATPPNTRKKRDRVAQQRLIRLVEHGWQHSEGAVLLTLADLSSLIGITTDKASHLLADARKTTGKPLQTKGYFFDQGVKPTHKEEIIVYYEQGMDEADIARATQHHPSSVGHYIRDYERVRLMYQQGHFIQEELCRLLDIRPSVLAAHLTLLRRFHPDLFSDSPHDC